MILHLRIQVHDFVDNLRMQLRVAKYFLDFVDYVVRNLFYWKILQVFLSQRRETV